MKLSRNQWIMEFERALLKWPGAKGFLGDGGVGGVRIPSGLTPRELGGWVLDHQDERAPIKIDVLPDRTLHLTPWSAENAVNEMRSEDNAYSPDY
jgi:hypothetical protein